MIERLGGSVYAHLVDTKTRQKPIILAWSTSIYLAPERLGNPHGVYPHVRGSSVDGNPSVSFQLADPVQGCVSGHTNNVSCTRFVR